MANTICEQFDRNYVRRPQYFRGVPSGWFLSRVRDMGLERGRALDLGSGCGRNSLELARVGFDVTAVDGASAATDQLLRFARGEALSVRVLCGDITEVNFEDTAYDLVVAATVLGHLCGEQLRPLADQLSRALRPGGVLLVEDFGRDDPGCRGEEDASEFADLVQHYFEPDELARLFSYLEPVRSEQLRVTDLTHGAPHRHELMRFVAQKRG